MSLGLFLEVYFKLQKFMDEDEEYEDYKEDIWGVHISMKQHWVTLRTNWIPLHDINYERDELTWSDTILLQRKDKTENVHLPSLNIEELLASLEEGDEISIRDTDSVDILRMRNFHGKMQKQFEEKVFAEDEGMLTRILGKFLRHYIPMREILLEIFTSLPLPKELCKEVCAYVD